MRGLPDPRARPAGLRGRRRHRHALPCGAGGQFRRRHRHGRQGHAPARRGVPRAGLPHGQGEVSRRQGRRGVLRRRARAGRRRPGPHGRLLRQHPRRAARRRGHGKEVDQGIRQPRRAARAGRGGQGQGRRKPARAQGRRAPLAPPRRDQDRSAHPVRHRGPEALRPRSREAEGALRRARVPLARGRDPGRGRAGGALLEPAREGQGLRRRAGRVGGRGAPDAQRSGPARRRHRFERRDRGRALRRDPRALDRPRTLGREARDPGRQAPRPPPRGGRTQRALGALRRGPRPVRALSRGRQLRLRAARLPAARPQGHARQGRRRRQRRAAGAGRDRVGRPLARRARLGRRGPGSPALGRARRPPRAREGLPRDRAAAHSGPRAHGARRDRDRRAIA